MSSNNRVGRNLPQVGVQRTIAHFSSGPLPPPDDLQRYNAILPGAAERILAMAEKQLEARLLIETEESASLRKMNEHDTIEANNQITHGQWFAFLICITIIGGGIWLISLDKSVWGAGTILTAVTLLAATFIGTKRV